MQHRSVLAIFLGIVLISAGLFLFTVVYMGSHGTLYFRPGHIGDWITWAAIGAPVIAGFLLLIRKKQ